MWRAPLDGLQKRDTDMIGHVWTKLESDGIRDTRHPTEPIQVPRPETLHRSMPSLPNRVIPKDIRLRQELGVRRPVIREAEIQFPHGVSFRSKA
jgi:hypothetical protein